jgi:peptidoglycan/xylan/chitin deacetylase (PgdA/CDA1 family)
MKPGGESEQSDEEETRPLPPTPLHPRRRRQLLWTASAILLVIGLMSGLIATAPLVVGDAYPRFLARLWSAPSPAVAPTPFPTARELPQTPLANSPQGCVNGQAPIAQSTAIISNATGQPYGALSTAPTTTPTTTPIIPPAAAHEVALTFDDGPNPIWTPQALSDLQAAGMHATFFPIGTHVQTYPALVRQEWQAGMAIGNHTLRHNHLLLAKPLAVRANLAQAATILTAAMGDPCLWLFRPPYGVLAPNSGVANEIRSEGYVIVNWDTEGHDWTRPGAAVIAQRVIAHLHPGAIILLHDGAPDGEVQDRSQTVQALPQILAALLARGLVSVTLPQLLRDSGLVSMPNSAHPVSSPTPPIGT